MEFFAGAVLDRPPGSKYASALGYAELSLGAPLPKPATMARWRKELPPGFRLGLRAPEACWSSDAGPLRPCETLDRGVGWLQEAIDALETSVVVVATGASVTTGARDRARLREYFARFPRKEGCFVVWRPTGLWEPELLRGAAPSLSVVAGFDAIDDPAPHGRQLYGSLRAEGFRQAFSVAQLADVAEKVRDAGAVEAFVSIESPHAFREAQQLQMLFEGAT